MRKSMICKKCKASFVPNNDIEKVFKICHHCLIGTDKKSCRYEFEDGRKCRQASSLDGYCMNHWWTMRDKNGLKKL